MFVTVLTLLPDSFPGPLACSVVGRAMKDGLWFLDVVDMRKYAFDARGSVDEEPYGGGGGMVIRADVLSNAIESIPQHRREKIIYMSPRGRVFNQKMATELACLSNVLFICGRFEGVDQRVIDYYDIDEISIGDYILSGGEIAAMAVIDSSVRNIAGVLGNKDSLSFESFSCCGSFSNLLEYHQYTRPSIWNDMTVPDVLMSGNHAAINKWRMDSAISVTKERRPDLWKTFVENKK